MQSSRPTPLHQEPDAERYRRQRDRAHAANVRAAERILRLQLDVLSLQVRLDAREVQLRELESMAGAA